MEKMNSRELAAAILLLGKEAQKYEVICGARDILKTIATADSQLATIEAQIAEAGKRRDEAQAAVDKLEGLRKYTKEAYDREKETVGAEMSRLRAALAIAQQEHADGLSLLVAEHEAEMAKYEEKVSTLKAEAAAAQESLDAVRATVAQLHGTVGR